MMHMMVLFVLPAICVAIICGDETPITTTFGIVLVSLFYVGPVGYSVVGVFRSLRQIRRHNIGLSGEQVMGQQLTGLIADGFRVFHDFPLEKSNVDHVVVGRTGVFAIETKTKRKPKNVEDGHKLLYNGRRLKFGEKELTKPVTQAERQAEELSAYLSKVLRKEIAVRALLVYPGWFITRETGDGGVVVLDEAGPVRMIPKEHERLDEETVESIAALVDDKCRDVEP